MRCHSGVAARIDFWLTRYLAMGPSRSLRALAATDQQDVSAAVGRVPAERTLFEWSRRYDWDGRARAFDAENIEETRRRLAEQHMAEAERRHNRALAAADGWMESALDFIMPTDERGHPVVRAIENMDTKEARLALDALKTARELERIELGEASHRVQVSGMEIAVRDNQQRAVTLSREEQIEWFKYFADEETLASAEAAGLLPGPTDEGSDVVDVDTGYSD